MSERRQRRGSSALREEGSPAHVEDASAHARQALRKEMRTGWISDAV